MTVLICGLFLSACGGGQEDQSTEGIARPHLIAPNSASAALPSSAPAVSRSRNLQPASPSPGTSGLEKMGVEVEPGRVIIDTRRVKAYLEALGRQLESGMHQGSKKAGASGSQGPQLGIRVSQDKIEIDLNKTRHFMQEWIEVMKVFGEELNRTLAPLH
jgi:hypothetical protein